MFNTLGNSISRSGLVGEWLLDGNALDTASTNNGTATNVVYVKTDKGYQSQAGLIYSGTSISSNKITTTYSLGAVDFSLSCWINKNNFKTGINNEDTIFGNRSFPNGWFLCFNENGGTTNRLSLPYGSNVGHGSTIFSTNKWYHILFIQQGNTQKVYVNGNLDISTSFTQVSSGTNFTIGNASTTLDRALAGTIQGVRLYNRILSQDEIQLLYLEGLRKLGPTATPKYPALLSGLVGYWDMKGTAHNLVDGVAGTVTGATLTQDRFGNSNSAYQLDGVNDNINIGNLFSKNIKSFSFYIKLDPVATYNGNTCVLGWIPNTTPPWGLIRIWGASGFPNCITFSGSSNFSLENASMTYTRDIWQLWTFTTDGTTGRVYRNGVLIYSASTTYSTLFQKNVDAFISYNQNDNTYAKFQIGEIFAQEKTISADEVKTLYDLTSQDYIYPTPSYDIASLRDGLVLDLNEQGYDLSGQGNNGTLVNGPSVVRQGRAKGLSYNGSNTRVDIPTSSSLNFGTGNFTFNFFGKFNTLNTYDAILNKYRNSPTNVGWSINSGTTNPTACYLFLYNSGAGGVCESSSGFLEVGKTNMYTIIRRGTNVDFYKNGLFFQTVSGYGIDISNNYSMSIGDYSSVGSLDGSVISPKIWNRALSAKEIQALYYSQKGNFIY